MSKYLIISRLQRDNGPSSLQFGRLWSNRFGENRLTDACRGVFSKQAAPKSHAFLFCHEPLSPGTRCGVNLLRKKSARSTEFPLRRLAVRGCERTMSGAERRAPMRSIGDRFSGAAECQGDCGGIEPTKPPTGMKWRLSIFEVALAIASAQRNLRSGFPYCGYQESRLAGSIGQRGGSYCRRASSVSSRDKSGQQIANRLKLTTKLAAADYKSGRTK